MAKGRGRAKAIRVLAVGELAAEAEALRGLPRGFRVLACKDLTAGLDRLGSAEFDAVLLDLAAVGSAPGGVAELHERAQLPIVAIARPDEEVPALAAIHAGAEDCRFRGEDDAPALARAIDRAVARFGVQHASEERFRLFLEHSPAAVAMFDRDMRFLLASRRWLQEFGLESRPVIGHSYYEVFPETSEDWRQVHRQALITGEGQGMEEEAVVRPDRSVQWIRWEVWPWHARRREVGGLVIFADFITELKLAQLQLRDREAHLRAVLENVIDGIVVFDESGRVHEFNKAAVRLFGYAAGAIMGQNVRVIIPGIFDVPAGEGPLAELMRDPDRVAGTTRELLGRRSDASSFPVEVGVSELGSEEGLRLIATCRDITERKRMEMMKSEFISMVSHELRTPLTSIQGALGLLAGGVAGELPRSAADLIGIAANSSGRLVRLINDILDIEKIEAGKMKFEIEPVSLGELIARALGENAGYAEQLGVRIEVAGVVPEARVNVDRDRFAQVMANLLSNAAKFSPRGGAVTVTAAREGSNLRISVGDQGPGIPEEFRPLVFQKFAQADSSDSREKGGTGLGLAICKAIVERLGGTIGFDTRVGAGTTFHFTLPLVGAPERAAPAPEAPPTGRVLICEDDPLFAEHLVAMLASGGIGSRVTASPAEAMELLKAGGFDAVTVDIGLPGRDGFDLIREAREHPATRDVPVLVLSSRPDRRHASRVGEADAVLDWLSKPLDAARLRETVTSAIRRVRGERPRILHVEDDADLCNVVSQILRDHASITSVPNLAEARRALGREPFDMVILDVLLPDGSGLELVPEIPRLSGRSIPVVVFSAIEVPVEASGQVAAALVKSRVPNERLLRTIESLIAGAARARS
ncbi:MAG: PAS domain S-box protein [Proteobacteria bacterium]|nr:PAS domain S-box protein [Pseudomonadota bacterium]